MGRYFLCIMACALGLHAAAQQSMSFDLNPPTVHQPQESPDFDPQLIHLEAPSPDGDSYRSFLMRQKIKQAQKNNQEAQFQLRVGQAPSPTLGLQTRMYIVQAGNIRDIIGGIPNDNTLAVSNDGLVLCGINSRIWAYNSNTDTTHFPNQVQPLRNFGGGSSFDSNFDPKIMYDPEADRWVLVYLQNFSPSDSRIKVCFSSTNDPNDPWYAYTLPGNPLNNDRWSDFPALSIANGSLFLTLNLIIPNVSWQVGFDGSIIWQMDLADGYSGAADLGNRLWYDIKYDGRYIRNLHPAWGHDGNAKKAIFLSNRNFDLSNDSIFVLELTGDYDDSTASLDIQLSLADMPYAVPPNARQADTDLNDPTKGLQTNDARVLGAITNGEWVKWVSNTRVNATGFSGIYFGEMNLNSRNTCSANIISHPEYDLGYPNLAWTGDESCDEECIIGFDYSSPIVNPGVGVVYVDNENSLSPFVWVKSGENHVDRHSDSYERWGDYFGLQRRFNSNKEVWLSGYFGNSAGGNATYVAQVFSPDTNQLNFQAEERGNPSICAGELAVNVNSPYPPLTYRFNDLPWQSSNTFSGYCSEDSIAVQVQDSRGCLVSDTLIAQPKLVSYSSAVFPNPSQNLAVIQFGLIKDQKIEAALFDEAGRLVQPLIFRQAKAGLNELRFNLEPLPQGRYQVRILGDQGFELFEAVIKAP